MAGTAPSLRASSDRILTSRVGGVRTLGKYLIIDFDNGWSVRVHLGMTGRWSVVPQQAGGFGPARLVLSTADQSAVCHAAPVVEVDRTPRIDAALERLGPDVLDDAFDQDEFLRRARLVDGARPIAQTIVDQRVIAGIGNVYKSEVLFLERIHPLTPTHQVEDDELSAIAARARSLMALNVRSGGRTTTGDRTRGRTTWVYDQAGRPCRRCREPIASNKLGDRLTYWCPGCQPDPQKAAASE